MQVILNASYISLQTKKQQCSLTPIMPDAVINFCNAVMTTKSADDNEDEASDPEESLHIMRMLIDHHCDVNNAGEDGLPLLHITARCPDIRALKLLLASGAKINLQNDRASAKGRSPLTKAVERKQFGCSKTFDSIWRRSARALCSRSSVSRGAWCFANPPGTESGYGAL